MKNKGRLKKMSEEKTICIKEINENLRRVELGIELTRPLAQLNNHCKFKKEYDRWCDRRYGKTEEVKARQREYHKKYYQKPEVKAKKREYLREYMRRKLGIKPEHYRVREVKKQE
ncbi:hypothetical protein GF386_04015 [Candidatus Pacearchaeota archaeon]|nr:hypothetical protein [Candidatus Pacearchaeota archaeon]